MEAKVFMSWQYYMSVGGKCVLKETDPSREKPGTCFIIFFSDASFSCPFLQKSFYYIIINIKNNSELDLYSKCSYMYQQHRKLLLYVMLPLINFNLSQLLVFFFFHWHAVETQCLCKVKQLRLQWNNIY